MPRFVPGQFKDYATTFWIPSQVEPAVALVGTSMPALKQMLVYALSGRISQRTNNFLTKDRHEHNCLKRLRHGDSGPQQAESSLLPTWLGIRTVSKRL